MIFFRKKKHELKRQAIEGEINAIQNQVSRSIKKSSESTNKAISKIEKNNDFFDEHSGVTEMILFSTNSKRWKSND